MQKITTKFTNKPETKNLLTGAEPCVFVVVKHATTGEKQVAMKVPATKGMTYLFIHDGEAGWAGGTYAQEFVILDEAAELNIKISPSN